MAAISKIEIAALGLFVSSSFTSFVSFVAGSIELGIEVKIFEEKSQNGVCSRVLEVKPTLKIPPVSPEMSERTPN